MGAWKGLLLGPLADAACEDESRTIIQSLSSALQELSLAPLSSTAAASDQCDLLESLLHACPLLSDVQLQSALGWLLGLTEMGCPALPEAALQALVQTRPAAVSVVERAAVLVREHAQQLQRLVLASQMQSPHSGESYIYI